MVKCRRPFPANAKITAFTGKGQSGASAGGSPPAPHQSEKLVGLSGLFGRHILFENTDEQIRFRIVELDIVLFADAIKNGIMSLMSVGLELFAKFARNCSFSGDMPCKSGLLPRKLFSMTILS